MLGQAAGFGLLAAISPTALLVMAVFLSSASPRQNALMYVAGATLMTVAMAVAVLYLIRATGLNQPRESEPRYGFRLGLGVVAAIAGAVIAWRGQSATSRTNRSDSGKGIVSRIIAQPTTIAAFVAGLVLFVPSAMFVAAVQVIATANAGVPVTVLGLLIVVMMTVLVVWVPLLTYLAAPAATTYRLSLINAWLRARGRSLVIGALGVGGVVLIINGALGLAGVL